MKILPGDTVVIKGYPKKELRRKVIEVRSPIILLTTEQEWEQAQLEKRTPICIGFRVDDVIRVEGA
jgi:hypothetical protein